MNASIHYESSNNSTAYPDQLTVWGDNYKSHVTVFVDTAEQAERLLKTVTAQRDALLEAEAKAAPEPEPVDGCTCGQPDLPSFDHAQGCGRRDGKTVAA